MSQYAEVVLCAWIGRQAVVAACNMAGLFSACFLVAVTQHAGSSHVIIEGKMETHGNKCRGWTMSILPRLRIQQVAALAGRDGCAHITEVSFVTLSAFLWLHVCAFVRSQERQGWLAVACHWYEVMKRLRKCCRTFAGRTSCVSAALSSVVFAVRGWNAVVTWLVVAHHGKINRVWGNLSFARRNKHVILNFVSKSFLIPTWFFLSVFPFQSKHLVSFSSGAWTISGRSLQEIRGHPYGAAGN